MGHETPSHQGDLWAPRDLPMGPHTKSMVWAIRENSDSCVPPALKPVFVSKGHMKTAYHMDSMWFSKTCMVL